MISAGALAHLRFPVAESRGRRYPENLPSFRNDFQRDRDRIVHSRAFRRLEDKTQVFPAGISDHFRNRLTHTLEVAQLARTAAKTLGLDEDLTEALALAHDIGHPPFAHAAEKTLDRLMAPFGERFEHNLHSLRIVEHLEHRYAMYPGLNLSFEVREGIVKHSSDIPLEAIGVAAEYLPGLRPPLEAQLIDLVDEIAYNNADVDDAHDAGFFPLAELGSAVPKAAEFLEELHYQFPAAEERIRLHELQRRLIDHLMRGLMEGCIAAVSASQVQTVEQVRQWPTRLIQYTAESQSTCTALKQFLHNRVYYTPVLLAERHHTSAAIERLFAHLLAHPDAIPESSLEDQSASTARQVCDYLASMTDGYFRRSYKTLFGEAIP